MPDLTIILVIWTILAYLGALTMYFADKFQDWNLVDNWRSEEPFVLLAPITMFIILIAMLLQMPMFILHRMKYGEWPRYLLV